MYCTYILINEKGGTYIGQTNDLVLRLLRHNGGKVFSTKNKGPWKILYSRKFKSRKDAIVNEKYLKKQKGGNGLKKILEYQTPR